MIDFHYWTIQMQLCSYQHLKTAHLTCAASCSTLTSPTYWVCQKSSSFLSMLSLLHFCSLWLSFPSSIKKLFIPQRLSGSSLSCTSEWSYGLHAFLLSEQRSKFITLLLSSSTFFVPFVLLYALDVVSPPLTMGSCVSFMILDI